MTKKGIINFELIRSLSSLPAALIVANFASFLFNAILGRTLSFSDFGIITVLNSFWYLLSIPINSLGGTTVRRVAYLQGRDGEKSAHAFFNFFSKAIFVPVIFLSVLWLLFTPMIMVFFHIQTALPVILFSPAIYFGTYSFVNRSYLQGRLLFHAVSITILFENISRLIVAILFVVSPFPELTYLSIPISVLLAYLSAAYYLRKYSRVTISSERFHFPKKFFSAGILSGLATTAFITIDVVLVQHYFDATTTGKYALLSLIGKMIYFLGTILNGVLFTRVSNHEGANRSALPLFYKMLAMSCIATFSMFFFLGPLGVYTTPLLFGDKISSIQEYLTPYSLGMALFTTTTIISGFHLTREKYRFLSIGILSTIALIGGVILFHSSLLQVTYTILTVSLLSLLATIMLHIHETYYKK